MTVQDVLRAEFGALCKFRLERSQVDSAMVGHAVSANS